MQAFTLTDGFNNGDTSNDHSYGRGGALLFSNKGNSQYPGSGQEGLVIKAETSMAYKNGNWSLYTE